MFIKSFCVFRKRVRVYLILNLNFENNFVKCFICGLFFNFYFLLFNKYFYLFKLMCFPFWNWFVFNCSFVFDWNKLFLSIVRLYTGFIVKLILVGVGYRLKLVQDLNGVVIGLLFTVGLSHFIFYRVPDCVIVRGLSQFITIFSFLKVDLLNFVMELRKLRIPDHYKGKGLVFVNEILNLKIGKQKQKGN